ncbi:DNA-formamidopyrimidine glycosylase family protein [Microbacterium sp. JZ31]|uniref:DNA-formamidopyrimidine glycosylase family protein n=1 Tax=Microbacterium sp. JZ31 TaxID=1906274 RepID=UPI00193355E7|nr:DNA-formamidopyrimidine glycosylase family protein [Microbacterium sp. JZ31]
MPESPEVDALAGILQIRLVGREVREVDLEEFRALKTRNRPLTELVGRTVTGVRRFGKHVSLDTSEPGRSGPSLLIGFGRAGWAFWVEEDAEEQAPVIARIRFGGAEGDDGEELALTDAGDWLSLSLTVTDDPTNEPSVTKLGPDPLSDDFTREAFEGITGKRRKQLKALLQEQESLAGIGNAYSDEILHAARLSPTMHAADLDEDERGRLYAAIREILRGAFAGRRDVPLERQKAEKVAAMRVHGRTGEPCPVCGDEVRDVPGSKGGAQYCATCQTGGVPL